MPSSHANRPLTDNPKPLENSTEIGELRTLLQRTARGSGITDSSAISMTTGAARHSKDIVNKGITMAYIMLVTGCELQISWNAKPSRMASHWRSAHPLYATTSAVSAQLPNHEFTLAEGLSTSPPTQSKNLRGAFGHGWRRNFTVARFHQ